MLPGCIQVEFLPNGLRLTDELSFDEWEKIGEQLRPMTQGHQWWIGDWLRHGGQKWGDKYQAAAERLGMKYGTLAIYKSVAEAYPEFLIRIKNLPFKHHQIAAPLPQEQRAIVLSRASLEGWSASRLREEIPLYAQPHPEPKTIPLPTTARVVLSLDELAGEKFGTIYADPPWKYGNQATRAATDDHYSTMTVDELCEMPVRDLAADDAHLHLWTTNGFLPDSFRLIAAWGFEYRSCFVWVKPQMGIGNYWRVSHEFLLLGIRGNAKKFARRDKKSWAEHSRGRHSAKPAEIRQDIEDVSPGPYLELFGRQRVAGWTVLGNQVEEMLFA